MLSLLFDVLEWKRIDRISGCYVNIVICGARLRDRSVGSQVVAVQEASEVRPNAMCREHAPTCAFGEALQPVFILICPAPAADIVTDVCKTGKPGPSVSVARTVFFVE
jgi:hypothetical protein